MEGAEARELPSVAGFVCSSVPVFVCGGEQAAGKVYVCFASSS